MGYYQDGVLVGNVIFGLAAMLILIALASSGEPIAILGLILLIAEFWVKSR